MGVIAFAVVLGGCVADEVADDVASEVSPLMTLQLVHYGSLVRLDDETVAVVLPECREFEVIAIHVDLADSPDFQEIAGAPIDPPVLRNHVLISTKPGADLRLREPLPEDQALLISVVTSPRTPAIIGAKGRLDELPVPPKFGSSSSVLSPLADACP